MPSSLGGSKSEVCRFIQPWEQDKGEITSADELESSASSFCQPISLQIMVSE